MARTLRAAIVAGALGGASLALIIAAITASIATARIEHSTLDAASSAVRYAVADADARHTTAELAAMRGAFATWGLSAAAFDRRGTFVAGDQRLRGDGLPAGRAPAPPAGRQIAIVDTHDGYVLLVTDPTVLARLRASVVICCLLTLAIVFIAAWVLGGHWSRAREHAAQQISRSLTTRTATGVLGTVVVHDALFGELSAEIAASVERLTRELVDRSEGEDRLRRFLAEAAHELRTPLAIAIGYVGILGRGAIGDADLAARIVRDVATEHTRLQQLVERILELARLDAVAGDLNAVSDVVRVVDEAIALVRPLDTSRTIDVEAAGAAWVSIASDDLREALRNMLENAIRYAPEAPIRVGITFEGDAIVVRVVDTGPGMDAFAVAHGFDRFFRGAQRGDVPGSGLGLSIVRRIAERAGGEATLTSIPEVGTTVMLRLPSAGIDP